MLSTQSSYHTTQHVSCYHCGNKVNPAVAVALNDKMFCCAGCQSVYHILEKNDLCQYYALNAAPGVQQFQRKRSDYFAYLDNPEVQQKLIHFTDGKTTQITFYIPHIHCSSCLWLLENMANAFSGIVVSRVHFVQKELFIIYREGETSLRQIVEILESMGYEPLLQTGDKTTTQKDPQKKQRIVKIGIAGFCFSNIMMMSFPEYFSFEGALDGGLKQFLEGLKMVLALPVLLYCAQEFFVSAWASLKNKYVNIDAPVALAIVITFGRSVYELLTQTGSGYLDSMAGIIFFMLVGRWFQHQSYRLMSFERDFTSFLPISTHVIKNGEEVPTPIFKIQKNDIIKIYSEEIIPADGIVSKGVAQIDYSFVTGESTLVAVPIGGIVYAGGKQVGAILEVVVVKEVSQSYLTHLWNNEAFKHKTQTKANRYDHIAAYFSYGVLLVGFVAGLYWFVQGQQQLMWNALTTVLIVACPCALLLSADFTHGYVLKILSRYQCYVRNSDVINKISRIKHIVFDKTGTLTYPVKNNIVFYGVALSGYEKQLVLSVLQHSTHPLSRILVNHFGHIEPFQVVSFKEHKGMGIEAWVEEQHVKIGSSQFILNTHTQQNTTRVYVHIGQDTKGYYDIHNVYREGVLELLGILQKKYSVSVLSGDSDAELDHLKKHIPHADCILFNQNPQQKLDVINQIKKKEGEGVMMIGDGLNDAGAFKASDVGVAVCDNMNTFTPASDVVLHVGQLQRWHQFLRYIKTIPHIVTFIFILSALYNFIGLYYAIQGTLSPLIAAILMPCSSLTIISLAYLLTHWAEKNFLNKAFTSITHHQHHVSL